MKIGNSPSPDGTASTAKAEQRPAARKADSTATTETTRSTAAAPAASTQVAISDAAKVDRIAKAISEGKFTVNANAIADKLTSNAQELLSARGNKH
jgi:negative regulator of flagellin synthesis FlgM